MSYQNVCSVQDCDRYQYSKGYCTKHYQRLHKYGNPYQLPIRVKYIPRIKQVTVRRICTVAGCIKPLDFKGLCQMHYTRLRNHGDVNKTIKVVGENRTKHPLYKSYHAMHDRCRNPNNTHYEYYGGRGISVCDRWSGNPGFANFIEDMGERPESYTLDRIDNNGNYEPNNCRWASKPTQQYNQRISVKNTSGYKGVSLYPNGKWTAQIYVKGKKKHLGYFATKQEANLARSKAENQS